MAFEATLITTANAAIITLSGELDSSAQQIFREQIEKAAAERPQRMVLMMQNLEYMSSAGLRALIYAKQKVGSEGDIYIIGAPEGVLETLEMTGFAPSVIIQETYDMSSQ